MKALLKRLAELSATLLVLPAALAYHTARLLCGARRAFPAWTQAFSLLPGTWGVYLRRAFYQFVFPCGRGSCICFGVVFSHPGNVVGRNVYIGLFCCLGEVTLEDDVLLGSHISITNGNAQHGIERLDIPVREQPGVFPHVTIGRDTWVGDRAIIMADVGKHCVIGAGSVVTRPIPDYAIAVGSPARVVRYRNQPQAAPAG